jgi:hypothetical protein
VEQIDNALANAPSTRWGTAGERESELRYWQDPQTTPPPIYAPFVLRP